MPELIFYRDHQEVIRYPFNSLIKLGRHPDNDLNLPHESVSRFHCTLEPKEGGFHLNDLSRNGTFLNGRRVKNAALKDRDEMEIGPWRIRFLLQEEWADRETAVEKRGNLPETFCGLVGKSQKMKEVYEWLRKAAPLSAPVLISGETGTGKELVAHALHELSERVRGPFVALNCGAISPQLIESELFGHEAGAFTGASGRHAGAFEQAARGTLFLDEVGEFPLDLQPKLLRVLEDQRFRRIGGREEFKTDARIIAATNRNLQEEVRKGKFREDLFYRLFGLPVMIPPLRERREDIPQLVSYFLYQCRSPQKKSVTAEAMELLQGHSWRGNIRELKNTIMRALFLSADSLIHPKDIQFATSEGAEAKGEEGPRSLATQEKESILLALEKHRWNKERTAKSLGIAKSTLYDKIKQYSLEKKV
ncbi:MAG: sigma 54-interacting transcriptional regulator [Deltaproteobacteria bacterium]|nr:sigma 54-interacting transcriptional regulator [Deltaproteobacteria bacterium]